MRNKFTILLILSLALHAAALLAFSSSSEPVRLKLGGPAVSVHFTPRAAPARSDARTEAVEIPAAEFSANRAVHAAAVGLDQPIHETGKPISRIQPIAKPNIAPSRPPVEKAIARPVEKPLEKSPETTPEMTPKTTSQTPAIKSGQAESDKPKESVSLATPEGGKAAANAGNKAAPKPTEVYPPSSAPVNPSKRNDSAPAAGSSGSAGSQAARLAAGNKIPPYPRLARERGYQGTTLLELDVSATGKVTGVKVARSSGHKLLDEAAAKDAMNWTFSPAMRDGKAVEDKVMQPVVFEIRE